MKKTKERIKIINYKAQFLKIGDISGMHYTIPGRKTKRVTIYGIGAPLPPDEGKLSEASTILSYDTDLYVPDYIGFGRSKGKFTPLNCVKTFLNLYQTLKQSCWATSGYQNIKLNLQYSDIHCMGRSWGGIYVTLLPRFNKEITNICSIFPVLDWANLGKAKNHSEETIKGFYSAMTNDGYKYLYRGIFDTAWKKHFLGKDGLSPIDNISYLKESRLFIGHGKKDTNIYYGNSVNYYKKVLEKFPDRKGQFKLKLYPYGHDIKTSKKTIADYFKWVDKKTIQTNEK